jgi:type IV pilus assembly protein PilP
MKTRRWLLLVGVLALAGCSPDEFDDLQDFVKNSGKDMRGKIEPPPEVKPYEPFTYDNSAGLPDPFKPRSEQRPTERGGGGYKPPPHVKEELENFPLESLKMVGFVYIHNTPNAVILDPSQKVHHVKVGNYIGLNFGQITEITETEVKIKEQVEDSEGNWTTRYSTLELLE